MSRPAALPDIAQLTRVLMTQPQSPSQILALLPVKISRATLHRDLAKLVDSGVIQRVGEGRGSAYRLLGAKELFDKKVAAKADLPLVRVTMLLKTAAQMREALEFATRIGIGQIDNIGHHLRWNAFGSGRNYSIEQIEDVEELLRPLKAYLTGYEYNASHGIGSHNVPSKVQTCWAVQRTLRHRLAWDRTPTGGGGVDFDEPILREEFLEGLVVTSAKDAAGEVWVHLQVSIETALHLVYALRVFARAELGQYDVLLQMARDGWIPGRDGKPASEEHLKIAAQFIDRIQKKLSFYVETELPKQAVSANGLADILEAVATKAVSVATWPAAGTAPIAVASSIAGQSLDLDIPELPLGYVVIEARDGRGFRVVGPSDSPTHLDVLSESHSVQTAVQMALNKINKVPARQWTM